MDLSPEQQKAIDEQKQHCPFCQIIAGSIPSKKVYEDDLIVALLDINPAVPGHLLVMPKEHYPIMPLIPPETFIHLFGKVPALSEHLRKAMVASHCSVFVANGQAAGQQAAHFLIHIIPSDKPLENFHLSPAEHDAAKLQQAGQMLAQNLPIMLRERSPLFPMQAAQPAGQPSDLAVVIEQNPQLKQAIMNNPDAVLMGIDENPSLKPLFEGVDIHALSKKLNEIEAGKGTTPPPAEPASTPEPAPIPAPPPEPTVTVKPVEDTPTADSLSDEQLIAFLHEKQRLRELLLEDMDTLKLALPEQPKLAAFFVGTTPEAVRDRVVALVQKVQQAQQAQPEQSAQPERPRRFGGGDPDETL